MSNFVEGWEITKLGNVSKAITSGSRDWAQYYSETGSKFIRMTNLSRTGICLDLNDLKYVDVRSNSADGKRTSLKYGDVLLSITAELGKIGWVPEDLGEAYINQHVALVRLNKSKVDSRFVAYLLASNQMNRTINRLNDSGAKSGLNLPTIKSIPVVLPPLPEQRKIAKILSTWDKAIASTEALIAASEEQKRGLMQELLTGKRRFGGFEGAWRRVRLGDVAEIIVSSVDKKTSPDEIPVKLCNYMDVYYNSRITSAIDFMKATATEAEINKCSVQVGDVLITKDSEDPKDIAIASFVAEKLSGVVCGYHLAIVRSDKNIIDGSFLAYLFSCPYIRYYFYSVASGATRFGLTIGAINGALFKIPSLPEQQKIAEVLSAADREIELLREKLAYLQEEKKGLMQVLLTGKRRVVVDEEEAVSV